MEMLRLNTFKKCQAIHQSSNNPSNTSKIHLKAESLRFYKKKSNFFKKLNLMKNYIISILRGIRLNSREMEKKIHKLDLLKFLTNQPARI